MLFENLELVKEYPGFFLRRTKPLKVYRTHEVAKSGKPTSYRYHFGYPEELVKPFCPLLETTPFWGEAHWTEVDGFWLWWTSITAPNTDYPSPDVLNKENDFRRRYLSKCLDFYSRTVK